MIILDQEVRNLAAQSDMNLIELAGRVCYKSEDKITPGSADKFVKMLIGNSHVSVIEHVRVAIGNLSKDCFDDDADLSFIKFTNRDGILIASANLRAWMELINQENNYKIGNTLRNILRAHYPIIFKDNESNWNYDKGHSMFVFDWNEMDVEDRIMHEAVVMSIVTNRAIQQQLTRHRMMSYSIESTRYCNYGKKGMRFIKPCKAIAENSHLMSIWEGFMNYSESAYNLLIDDNMKPDQARGVLPLDLACDMVMSGTCEMWGHIIDERTQNAAHEQAQEIGWGMHDIICQHINEWSY